MNRLLVVPLVVLATACAGQSSDDSSDLGSFGGGKNDFVGIDIDLSCLPERQSGSDDHIAQFTLSGSGSFRVDVTQPNTPSSQQALVRIIVDDGQTNIETSSDKAPSLTWDPQSDDVMEYSLSIVNRSYTRELCAHLVVEEISGFVPPNVRRTFADDFQLDSSAQSVSVAFFDADSTLRISKSGEKTPNGPDDVMLLPGVATGIRAAAENADVIAVVSNQGGVHYGHITVEDAEAAIARTAQFIADGDGAIHYFDFAEAYDENRKPQSGMATQLEDRLQSEFGATIDWDASYMVGDAGWKKGEDLEPDGTPGDDFSNSDRGFAEGLGIDFHHPRDYFGWAEFGVRNFHKPDQVEDFLKDHPDFGD